MSGRVWTEEQVRALGVRTDLVTACEVVYGCGRTKAYELYRRSELPFPTLRVGNRIVVPVAPLLEALLIADLEAAAEAARVEKEARTAALAGIERLERQLAEAKAGLTPDISRPGAPTPGRTLTDQSPPEGPDVPNGTKRPLRSA